MAYKCVVYTTLQGSTCELKCETHGLIDTFDHRDYKNGKEYDEALKTASKQHQLSSK